ncbi:ATP-binding protein [Streptomyces vinaceus]|uniref:ATP-binding protein n=1 Tax=Streptomyces vinaceus TaxID=1960 RepID=UPI0036B853C9
MPLPSRGPAAHPDPRNRPHRRLHARTLTVLDQVVRPAAYSRRALTRQLKHLGLLADDGPDRHRAEEALLIVGELVGNACRHSSGPTLMTSQWHPRTRRLTLAVSDPSPGVPRRKAPDERGEGGGYGVLLIDILAGHWNTVRHGDGGKAVVVTLDFPPPPADPPTPPQQSR